MNKKQQRNYLILGAVAIVVIFAIFLVLNNGGSSSSSQSNVIRVGVTFALTGKYSYIGQQELEGLQMAVDEINSNGGIVGKKVKIFVGDNGGSTSGAVKNVNKLINIDNVDVIFSAFTSITNAIKKQVFNNGKILFYASTVKNIAEENKYAFRDYYDAKENGKAIADAVHAKGYKNVAFLTEISNQCSEYEDSFLNESSKFGIRVISKEQYQPTETDLKTYLLKLKLKNVDALVTCSWRHENILMKQLKELNLISVPTFHFVAPFLPIANTPEMKKLFEENGAISTWYGFSETGNKELQKKFIEKFNIKYNKQPTPEAAYIYDDLYILKNAIEKCNSISKKDCIANEILKTNYTGVGGRISFDKDGSAKREIIIIRVKNGKWQTLSLT